MLQRAFIWSPARFAALVFGMSVAGASAGSAAVPGSALTWMLSSASAARSCQMSLRFNAEGAAGGLTLPAGCRHAIPGVRMALTWSIGTNGSITLLNASGGTVLAFERQADGTWHGTDAEGEVLVLTPTTAAAADPAATVAASGGPVVLSTTPLEATSGTVVALNDTSKQGKAAATATDQATAKDVAGRYAVMRGDRDTGCMVTLETENRGPKNSFRARLAPACRDQGIIVFDPIGWQAKGATLKLTARKGHSIDLNRDANGVFVKMPEDAKALGLKRL